MAELQLTPLASLLVSADKAKVEGDNDMPGYEDEIVIHSWCWGVASTSAVGSQAGVQKRVYRPLVVWKAQDSATNGLLNVMKFNYDLTKVCLTVFNENNDSNYVFQVLLTGAKLMDIDWEIPTNGSPVERLTFNATGGIKILTRPFQDEAAAEFDDSLVKL